MIDEKLIEKKPKYHFPKKVVNVVFYLLKTFFNIKSDVNAG